MAAKVQFINSTGTASEETKRAHRRLVRSHVTSQRYQEKRKREVKKHALRAQETTLASPSRGAELFENGDDLAPSLPHSRVVITPETAEIPHLDIALHPFSLQDGLLSPATSTNSDDELRLESDGGHLIPLNLDWRPSPNQYLGQGVSDPFNPMPRPIDPRMSKHLYYYVNIMMPEMHPSYSTNMNRKTFGCKAWVWTNELTMSSISAFSATCRALMSGDLRRHDRGLEGQSPGFHDGTVEWLYFKGLTIHIVNNRLADIDLAVSDVTIAGISDLILLETFTGNIADATAHMNGLSRVAALRARGGPLPYSTAAKVTAADIKLATLSGRKPIAPFTLFPKISLPLPSISHLLPNLAHSLIEIWPEISEDRSMIKLFHDMASQTRHTEAVYQWIYPYAEDDAYYEYINDHNLCIEHRLLSYTSSSPREECVKLACILYCNTALIRGYPLEAALIHNTLVALKRTLEECEEGCKDVEELQLWVLFIGVYASRGQEEERFFAETFQKLASDCGFSSWEDVKTILQGYLFEERMYVGRLKEVLRV